MISSNRLSFLFLASAMTLLFLNPVILLADSFQQRLDSMPWYDAEADDYRKYTKEDLEPFLNNEEEIISRPQFDLPASESVSSFFLYGILIFVLAYLVYLTYTKINWKDIFKRKTVHEASNKFFRGFQVTDHYALAALHLYQVTLVSFGHSGIEYNPTRTISYYRSLINESYFQACSDLCEKALYSRLKITENEFHAVLRQMPASIQSDFARYYDDKNREQHSRETEDQ